MKLANGTTPCFALLTLIFSLTAQTPPALAKGGNQNVAARVALGKALGKGDLDGVRVAWTIWQTREVSQTVEIQKGKLVRKGGYVKNERSERPLTPEEKTALLAALRGAHADKLVWIDRDVKNDQDRVLNLDIVQGDGSLSPVGAFVRTGSTWHSGATSALADVLEKWLSPASK
jgi:hypothetical protein